MSVNQLQLGVGVLALLVLSGCGSPGVPLPPSLELARPVSDLRAVRKGNTVYLSWSAPETTTDRHNIRHPGPMEICRSPGTTIRECVAVGRVPFARPVPPTKGVPKPQVSFSDQLPAKLLQGDPASTLVYAVSALNSYGKSAGLSNPVQVPALPTLSPPDGFQAQLTAEGVRLFWKAVIPAQEDIPGVRYLYRVYRRDAGGSASSIAGEIELKDAPSPSLLDNGFTWEKTYDYRLTAVTVVAPDSGAEQQVEGDDTPAVTVVAHDVFPPAVPTGLQAVFSGPGQKPFIDLIWAPDAEPDLAGYNVYRHEADGPPAKLNSDLVKTPTFRDREVLAGHQYFYSVSAADVRGNESTRSEEASEAMPAQ
jgi:hypothetical protein